MNGILIFVCILITATACNDNADSPDGDLQDGDIDKIDGDGVDGDEPDGDRDTDNDPDNDIVEDGDLEPDVDIDSDSDDDNDSDMPCISCDASTETGCFMDKVAGTCSMKRCEDGCLIEEKTPEGRYGYCDPLPGRGCVYCDTRNTFGAFLDCDPLYPDGPPDDLPEGAGIIDDGSLMRGYLTENPSWQDRLNPGEIRLSEFMGTVGDYPIDMSDDFVIWVNWDFSFVFVYHVNSGFVQALRPSQYHAVWVASVDGDTIYAGPSIWNEDTQDSTHDVIRIDPLSRQYKVISQLSQTKDSIYNINARNGMVALARMRKLEFYFPDTDTVRSYFLKTDRHVYLADDFAVYALENPAGPDFYDVQIFDIETAQRETITGSEQPPYRYESNPNTDGKYIVWYTVFQNIDQPWELEAYEIETGHTFQLETVGDAQNPMIDNEVIVWSEKNSEGFLRIRLYDISTGSYHWVTNTEKGGNQDVPRLFGRWLTYYELSRFSDYTSQDGHFGYTVMLYDLCTMELFKNREMCRDN